MKLRGIICAGLLLLAPTFASADTAICSGNSAIGGTFTINGGHFTCQFTQGSVGSPAPASTILEWSFDSTTPTGAIAASTELGLFGPLPTSATLSWIGTGSTETVNLLDNATDYTFGGNVSTVFGLGESKTLRLEIGGWLAPTQMINLQVFALDTPPDVVPLPAAAWLFGSALFGLAVVGRRKSAV